MVRRIVAALLANVMIFTTSVQTINAGAETKKSAAENVSLSNDEIKIESTNSFGSILAKEISAEQEEQLANNGCNVFSIEMDGTQANVEFQTVNDCTLVVGVYDETGETLLATGSAEVLHDQTEAAVSIEIDAMPEYFYLKGYLIESTDLAPMCTVYENPNYTQKMQEFFSKTVDDFDAERVLNFDNDPTNNFAVYEENTILIPQNDDGYNVVASADDAACVYVIKNVDDSFLSLEAGDIFAYQYGENDLLITKIAEIEVDDTTVTITGSGVSMDEIFEFVRIDVQQNMDDAEIIPAEGAIVVNENGDAVTEESLLKIDPSKKMAKANEPIDNDSDYLDGLTEGGLELSYTLDAKYPNIDKNKIDFMEEYFEGSVEISGGVNFKAGASFREYIADDIEYTELLIGFSCGFSITASGSVALKFPIGEIGFDSLFGLKIKITPAIIFKIDGEFELSGKWYGSAGVRFNISDGGGEYISRSPVFKTEIKSEVRAFLGVDLQPQATMLNEKILNLEITSEVGVEAVSEMSVSFESDVKPLDSYHACKKCIDTDLNVRCTIGAELEIANSIFCDPLTITLPEIIVKFGDLYYSFDYDEFDFGKCPHVLYKVGIECVNLQKRPIENVSLTFSSPEKVMVQTTPYKCEPLEDTLLSDENGKAVVYIGKGTTTIETTKERFVDSKSNLTLTVDKNGDLKINNTKTNQHQIVMAPVAHMVSIHVENEEGNPLEFAKVSIAGDGDTEYTNASGDAELKLPNGTYELTISDTGYQAVTQTLTIYDEGQSLSFQLVTNPYVYVRVTDEYGQPLQNAKVLISGVNDLIPHTNAEGMYKTELEEGDYTITVSKINYKTKECSFTFTGDFLQVDVVLVCTLPKVTVTVEDEAGNLIEGAEVTYEGSENTVLTGADGTAVLRIPLGDCTIKASAEGFCRKSQAFTVDAEEASVILVLPSQKEIVSLSTVSLGDCHSAAITEEGSLYLWGYNGDGQLGDGTTTSRSTPIKIMDNVAAVSLGLLHSAAITEDGSLYLWGYGFFGNLGDGSLGDSSTPIKIMDNVTAVSLGDLHSAAITEDGSLYMWGNNGEGQLGDGSFVYSSTPIKIMDNVAEVGLGYVNSAVITEDGSLYMWGDNDYGQLGNGNTNDSLIPIKIMDNVAAVSLGLLHSAVITEDGSLYMWGDNDYGQLGNGNTNDSLIPIKIMDNVAAVSLGNYHSAVITEDSSLYLWGYNVSGQLGDGSLEDSYIPIKIMDNVTAVSLGGHHSAAITEDGSLYMCGDNSSGQLGNDTTKNSYTPIKIMDGVAIGGKTETVSFTAKSLFTAAKTAAPNAKNDTVATKSYTDLLPDTLYNFYVLRSDTAENLLSADNLLYLNQYTSTSDGTLDITYTPIEDVADAVLLAVPAQRTIPDASIVLEDMVYDGTAQTVNPVVTYGGVTLIEGIDYTLSGDTNAEAVGAYMLTITGKGDYSGELTISYWMYCKHSYADGVCTICETQCVHTYENGLCSVCGDILPITTTTSTTVSTTTTTPTTKRSTTTNTSTILSTTTTTTITMSTTSNSTTTITSTTTDIEHSVIASGTYGENIIWKFDNYGTLSISGKGDMANTNGINSMPWQNYKSLIANVVIEDDVTSIGNYVFSGCTALTSVSIGNSVIKIGDGAFRDCNLLTAISIPYGVTRIGSNVFVGCDSLTTITIPDSVTNIMNGAFNRCSINKLIIEDGSKTITSSMTKQLQHKIEEVIIPESVTSIEDWAFGECEYLTSITIPRSVTSIGNYAFYNCQKLTSVTLPDSVISVGDYAFRYCLALSSLTIENVECEMYDSSSTIYYGATIYGYNNSSAYTYAEKYNRKFVALDKDISTPTTASTTTPTTTTSTTATTTMSATTVPPATTEPAYLLGDVNEDGSVDSSDASLVLAEYAKIQTGGAGEFTETQHKAADVNNDGVVDSSDASKILAYYAMISTGKDPTWD